MKELIIELTKEEEMQIFGGRVVYEIININGKDILIRKEYTRIALRHQMRTTNPQKTKNVTLT